MFVERRDEAVALPVRLGAFAEREDVRVARAHVRTDNDAAVDGKARVAGDRGARPDADRHDDKIGGKLGPVVEQHTADA
jgi:hypothetical protein